MAFAQDLLTRIVNVQWGTAGAIFVAVGFNGVLLYCKITNRKNKPQFTDLGDGQGSIAAPGDGGSVMGVSYRRLSKEPRGNEPAKGVPTFVSCGLYAETDKDGRPFSRALIQLSEDGKTWRTVYTKLWLTGDRGDRNNEAEVFFLAWEEDRWYASASSDEYWFAGPNDRDLEVRVWEYLLASPNGESWSEVGSLLRYDSQTGQPVSVSPKLITQHVNPNTKLPDGVSVYWEEKDSEGKTTQTVMARPQMVSEHWYNVYGTDFIGDYGPVVEIELFDGEERTKKSSTTPIAHVFGVGYANGIFMAVGGDSDFSRAQIAWSVDDGDTWEIVHTVVHPSSLGGPIFAVAGAPLEDFPSDKPNA